MTDLDTLKSAFETINLPHVIRTLDNGRTYVFVICRSPIDRKALEKATYKQLRHVSPCYTFDSLGGLEAYPGCTRDKIRDIVLEQKAEDTCSPDVVVGRETYSE